MLKKEEAIELLALFLLRVFGAILIVNLYKQGFILEFWFLLGVTDIESDASGHRGHIIKLLKRNWQPQWQVDKRQRAFKSAKRHHSFCQASCMIENVAENWTMSYWDFSYNCH